MDSSETHRRSGSETGPNQFCKSLKTCALRSINDAHSTYLNCFSYIGTDVHFFQLSSFNTKVEALLHNFEERDTIVCIGGDSSVLPTMVEINPDFDVILKISPCLSRGALAKGGTRNHDNYITSMDDSTRSKIVHFGLLDYTNSQSEADTVLQADKARVVFLDKTGTSNLKAFSELLNGLPPKTKLCVMLDCESLTSDYFPGVTNPSVFGFEEKEIFGMMERLAISEHFVKTLLFANYNPAVESRRSGDFLTYLVFTYLSKSKSVGSSAMASESN
jgi:hypothetical protein